MVKIRKGNKHLSVPAGSLYKYLNAGWELSEGSKKHTNRARVEDTSALAVSIDEPLEDEVEEVEYVDPEELAKRPISELDREELRILAEFKGLNPDDYGTTKQLRSALRSLE